MREKVGHWPHSLTKVGLKKSKRSALNKRNKITVNLNVFYLELEYPKMKHSTSVLDTAEFCKIPFRFFISHNNCSEYVKIFARY